MNKKVNLSRLMALGMLGSVATPYTSLADKGAGVGPIATNSLTRAVFNDIVKEINEEDLVKTRDDYKISFLGKDNLSTIPEGAVYLVYPVQLHTKSGESINLGDPFANEFGRKDAELLSDSGSNAYTKDLFKYAKKVDHDSPVAELDYDGVYRIVQLQRAPGQFLNPYLQADRFVFPDWSETEGFEFPLMKDGLISDNQEVEVNTKKAIVDDGIEYEYENASAFAELLVGKFGIHERQPGYLNLNGLVDADDLDDEEEYDDEVSYGTKYEHLGKHRQKLDNGGEERHNLYSSRDLEFLSYGDLDDSPLLDSQKLEGAKYKITLKRKVKDVYSNIHNGIGIKDDLSQVEDLDGVLNIGNNKNYRNAIKEFEDVEDEYFSVILENHKEKGWLFKTGKFDQDIYGISADDFVGLPEGEYVIEEVVPPKGYTLTNDKVNVILTVDADGVKPIQGVSEIDSRFKDDSDVEEDESGSSQKFYRPYSFANLVNQKDSEGTHRYMFAFNNSLKPGTDDPNNPFNEDRDPFTKTSELDGVVTSDKDTENRIVAPGRLFDYNLDFYVPLEIDEYEYLELYDHFDESLDISKLGVEVSNNYKEKPEDDEEIPDDDENPATYESFASFMDPQGRSSGEDGFVVDKLEMGKHFNLVKEDNKVKVVFTEEGLSELKPNSYVQVKFKDVRIRENLTKDEIDSLEETGIDNIAKLHFDNGEGTIVNPKDPDKPVGEDNPHVTPNPEDPFTPGEEVEPKDPDYQPEVPESNVTTVIPTAHDFRFTKVNKEDRGLEGAMFVIVDGEISSEYGESKDALTNKFDIDKYEKLIEEGKASEANQMLTDFESKEFEIDEHKIEGRNLVATSDTDGKVEFKGLPAGKYTIREVKAPNGYRVSPLPIEVEIDGAVKDGKAATNLSVKYNGETHNFAEVEDTDLKIVNYKYNETPETGTLGKLGYIAAGTLVLSLGVVTKKKKED